MITFNDYRDLEVWRRGVEIVKQVYLLTQTYPPSELYGITSQIRRAAISIPANIAEGWARESNRERAQFLAIAQGSLAETETLLTLCEETGWFPAKDTAAVRGLMEETGKMLSTMRRKLRENR